MIKNPVIPGFNPDPSICRKDDTYYIAVSTFEWFPGVAIYKSYDLQHWKLFSHALKNENVLDLRRLEASKGIWAPCLTWCETDGLFYLVYTIMQSMNSGFFDLDNYVITSRDIEGPWSDPVYLNSSGFDPSLFHDDDGRKWLVNLEWESRIDYEHPGIVVLQEYSPEKKTLIAEPKRIWRGGTDRGDIEGPHLYKRNGYYYLMCAEGGTGYGHCVTMARSKSIMGSYEGDPQNPVLTSTRSDFYSRHDPEFLKPYAYNPNVKLQKAGHASWVETPQGEHYIAHLCARPVLPHLRCILGRETAIQKVYWTEDGWLRMCSGNNLPQMEVIPPVVSHEIAQDGNDDGVVEDHFDCGWDIHYYTPRISPVGWVEIDSDKNILKIRGQESLSSLNRVSLVARRVISLKMAVSTRLFFTPECFQESAGICFYYNNANYVYFRLYYSESLQGVALGIRTVNQGIRSEHKSSRVRIDSGDIYLKISLDHQKLQLSYSEDSDVWKEAGSSLDATLYSDECCGGEGFTGAFVGFCCIDSQKKSRQAEFSNIKYRTW